MGPKEKLYREKIEGWVYKTIRSHALQGGTKLPSYKSMNEGERVQALGEVDRLLQRLNCGSAASSGSSTAFSGARQSANETFGSATTMGEDTLQNNNLSMGSATTMGEQSRINQSVRSVTTMGNKTTLNQSESLLEESLILLSDEEGSNNEEESRFSGGKSGSPASIERTRHAHKPSESMLFDNDMDAESPSFEPKSIKRSASNSGKRGLKSRLRVDEFQDAESSLLKHFDDNNELQDGFSCGSPIQQRLSCDELDLEERDTVSEMVNHDRFKSAKKGGGDEESEEYSRFSLNEDVHFGNCDYEDDYGDNNDACKDWGDQQSQQNNYQQSQWSTFQNADAKLTLSEEEDNSPVRRRAIRFELSQRVTTSKKQHSAVQDLEEESDEEASLEEKMADMAVGDTNTSAEDDPIQTVRNLSRRAKALEEQGVDSSLLDEVAPTDIRLRDGAHFRMDPLRCRQTKDKTQMSKSSKNQPKGVKLTHPKDKAKAVSSKHYESESDNSLSDPEPSFTDPITRFPTRVASRLNTAFDFIMEKERGAHQPHTKQLDIQDANIINKSCESCGVLISMPIQQVVSVTSKLLIQTIKSARMHQHSMNGLSKKNKRFTPMNLSQEKDVMAGGTLIVVRGKEDIAQWEVALREYTSLSVMNHAEMQSNLRKLANTAAKCAGFDIVLST
jgi:hypothetical protein